MRNDNPFLMVDKAGNYKSFDFSPWGGIDGFLEMSKNSSQNGGVYKRLVPDLLRAVDMTATAVASLPFDICDEEENVVDSSVDWENVLGGWENPQRLIYLLASSLCGGSAYVIPTVTGKLIFDLQYCAPYTIQPDITRDGLRGFDRVSEQGKPEKFAPDELLYFWLPDSDVEIGPALSHPLGAATAAAGLSLNMSNSLIKISERGFIPPTIMGVDGMTLPGEKDRVEKWWNSFLRGAFSQIAKIVNAQKVTITQVGAGMEQLKGTYVELKREASEDIAKAFGIPAAVFMSDKAFATEYNPLIKQWYSNSIFTTIYHTIEEGFSDQLLKQFGYKMYFRPETLDAFQTDENARGQSVSVLTNAINTNPKVAMWVMEYVLDNHLTLAVMLGGFLLAMASFLILRIQSNSNQ
jgi:phage portal protein BeeE